MCDKIVEYYETTLPNGKAGLREEISYAFCDDLWREIKSYMFHPPHIALAISNIRISYYITARDDFISQRYHVIDPLVKSDIKGSKALAKKIYKCDIDNRFEVKEIIEHPLWNMFIAPIRQNEYGISNEMIEEIKNVKKWNDGNNFEDFRFVDINGHMCYHIYHDVMRLMLIGYNKLQIIEYYNKGKYPEPQIPKNDVEDSWSIEIPISKKYNYSKDDKIYWAWKSHRHLQVRLKIFKEKVDALRNIPNVVVSQDSAFFRLLITK